MKARARFAMLITLLVFAGIGAEWWMEGVEVAVTDASRLDGSGDIPPTPSPMP